MGHLERADSLRSAAQILPLSPSIINELAPLAGIVGSSLPASTGAQKLRSHGTQAPITPGLDTVLVLRTAAVEGPRRAMLAGLGICCGCLTWGFVVSVGLGALLAASRVAYGALRLAGTCYLVFLGMRMLVGKHRPALPIGSTLATPARENAVSTSGSRWFIRGLLTNLLNPKVGVFYVGFLPQFIPVGVLVTWFSMLLATIHAAQGILWFSLLTLATRPLSLWLQRPRVAQALDRATGGILVGFGVALAVGDRQ
jgi:threonine/homoserine/homoserine lactone efflux protein